MKRLLLPLALAATLPAGCATAPSEPSVCPRPVEYSRDFQARLADEMDALSPGSAVETALLDYQRERDMLRACRSR